MQTFRHALIELVLAGKIDRDIAANASTNRHDFLVALESALKLQAHEQRVAEEEANRPKHGIPGLRVASSGG